MKLTADKAAARDPDDVQEGDMTIADVRQVMIETVKLLKRKTGDWAVRDTLTKLSEWGFYKGPIYASIDEEAARDILNQLEEELEYAPDHFVEELYDELSHWAPR